MLYTGMVENVLKRKRRCKQPRPAEFVKKDCIGHWPILDYRKREMQIFAMWCQI